MSIKILLKNNIWLVILLAVLISFVFPTPGLFLKPYIGYLLMILMFLSCLEIKIRQIVKACREYKEFLVVLSVVHLVSPLLVLLLKPFFSEQIFLGLILATVISSGMAVIFLSNLFGGLPAKALVITSLSNILSPITIPLLVLLFARTSIEVDVLAMSWTIIKLVVIPIALAQLVSKTKLKKVLSDCSSSVSITLLFLIMLGIVSPVKDLVLSDIKLSLVLSLIAGILISINFIIGYLFGDDKKEKITYGISASYKNFTLATVIAMSLFNETVALPIVIYAVMNNLSLIPLQLIFIGNHKSEIINHKFS